MSRTARYASWALAAFGAYFCLSGVQHLLGSADLLEHYAESGLAGGMRPIGVAQVVGGTLLMVPRTRLRAALAVSGVMLAIVLRSLARPGAARPDLALAVLAFTGSCWWLARRRHGGTAPAHGQD